MSALERPWSSRDVSEGLLSKYSGGLPCCQGMQTSDELGAAPDVTRLSSLSVTPLPHHGKPYLGISTIVIHFVALPLNSQ